MEAPLHSARGWQAYMLIMLAFNLLIWAAPLLPMAGSDWAGPVYEAFAYTCHQLDARSLCVYPNASAPVQDCAVQDGKFHPGKSMVMPGLPLGDVNGWSQYTDGPLGFKLPVCARDIGIYGGMLLGGLLWLVALPRLKLRPDDWPHPLWLVLALGPLALDGTLQLLGGYESSNAIRLLTGLLAGAAMAFYALPGFFILLGKRAHPHWKN